MNESSVEWDESEMSVKRIKLESRVRRYPLRFSKNSTKNVSVMKNAVATNFRETKSSPVVQQQKTSTRPIIIRKKTSVPTKSEKSLKRKVDGEERILKVVIVPVKEYNQSFNDISSTKKAVKEIPLPHNQQEESSSSNNCLNRELSADGHEENKQSKSSMTPKLVPVTVKPNNLQRVSVIPLTKLQYQEDTTAKETSLSTAIPLTSPMPVAKSKDTPIQENKMICKISNYGHVQELNKEINQRKMGKLKLTPMTLKRRQFKASNILSKPKTIDTIDLTVDEPRSTISNNNNNNNNKEVTKPVTSIYNVKRIAELKKPDNIKVLAPSNFKKILRPILPLKGNIKSVKILTTRNSQMTNLPTNAKILNGTFNITSSCNNNENISNPSSTITDIPNGPPNATENTTNQKVINLNFSKEGNGNPNGSLCRVTNCTGNQYFLAPSSPLVLDIWRTCIGSMSLKSGDFICSKHFLKEDVLEVPREGQFGRLKDHVVPSRNPIFIGCVIRSCEYRNKNLSNMYPLPAWSNILFRWLPYLTIKWTKDTELLRYRVCQIHFDDVTKENMFKLVPNLHLPSFTVQTDSKENADMLICQRKLNNFPFLCAFLYCDNSVKSCPFVKFPKDMARAKAWLKMCKRYYILRQGEQSMKHCVRISEGVCFKHYQMLVEEELKAAKFLNNKKIATIESFNITEEPPDPPKEHCAFVNCSTHMDDPLIRKFKLPKNKSLQEKWLKATGLTKQEPNNWEQLFICGYHFNDSDFIKNDSENGDLMPETIPNDYRTFNEKQAINVHRDRITKALENQNSDYVCETSDNNLLTPMDSISIQETSRQNVIKDKDSNAVKCCVKHCKETEKTTELYSFPLQIDTFNLCVKALKNRSAITMDDFRYYRNQKICGKHFEEKHFDQSSDKVKLKENAIPTLCLHEESRK
ncbi:hypothetical protein ABEB36_003481 [Hypothenemus hampei]|uniref:THAP-type domain-containing protein n=1 Tax=Hypothenemus hampei TaxID=57062 RepID=A0ABD1FCX4_HYPHA